MAEQQRRRTQAERIAATEDALYEAAIQVIARDGAGKLTLANIAKMAGVSPGLVNHRFGSKSNLLQMTCMKVLDAWSEILSEVTEAHSESSLKSLEALSRLYLEGVSSKSDIVMAQGRLMAESVNSLGELQPAFKTYNQRVCQSIVELLKPGQNRGEIKSDVDLKAFAVTFVGTLRGVGMLHLVDDSIDLEAACGMVVLICKQLLQPDTSDSK
ncbi:TetR/AcrR family transcriptional regulator [Pseudomaricurvus alkylphenolicus]|jgi:AcrR family transcriptional regulator|uniref:TetR/AcrR family transcriptional regulator n=1 Tax=Pseudomaricurvus alkylphenolicus TaxID=1306991 RepID=UPI00142294D8|nr:TetR/AcrR family transcriptional regulator [Pseudomaricurvus alkylphenolicus]NIB38085.1 TetR/AcrR family transcriptional regulator [Pseudomaricurvus alkylphenolicus]